MAYRSAREIDKDGENWRKSLALRDLAIAKRTSLTPIRALTIEDWKRLGEHICVINNCSAWWIGDWLVYGENRYPERYKKAISDTALDYQTLKNYAWVARKFAVSRRRDQLSFQHHVEVAALSEADQDMWLEMAEKLRLSRNQLRQKIRESRHDKKAIEDADRVPPDKNPDDEGEIIHIQVVSGQRDAWRDAARSLNIPLKNWIVGVLDAAVDKMTEYSEASPRICQTVDGAIVTPNPASSP